MHVLVEASQRRWEKVWLHSYAGLAADRLYASLKDVIAPWRGAAMTKFNKDQILFQASEAIKVWREAAIKDFPQLADPIYTINVAFNHDVVDLIPTDEFMKFARLEIPIQYNNEDSPIHRFHRKEPWDYQKDGTWK